MKRIIWGLIFTIVLVVGVFAYIFTEDLSSIIGKKDEVAFATNDELETKQEANKVEVAATEGVQANPFDSTLTMEELNDSHYKNYIHAMSHQKVEASEKWGFYLITEERINWLLEGLEVADLEHENVYRDILERWANGDFSAVDQDHNTIWRMQNGTIGEATGILSPEEEAKYIESQN